MPRPSGTSAIPSRAMRCAGHPLTGVPWTSTWPERAVVSPRTDRMVVVFPIPLRPIRVTVSPLPTAKLTPCRTWLAL